MLNEALLFLLDVIVQSFATILLLRFHLQWLRAPMRNPIGEFVMAFSDFLVLRVRRYIPAMRGYDTATLLCAWVIETVYLALVAFLASGHFFSPIGFLVLAVVKLLSTSIYILMAALFAQVILSWINPYTPIAAVLNAITYRFLRPLRRFIPMIGNIDLSPMALLVICQLLLILPVAMLENLAARLL
jgi:YggT family protein